MGKEIAKTNGGGAFATVKALLEKKRGDICQIIPKHLTPERLFKVAYVAFSRNPKILECTPESIVFSLLQAAELGLEPGSFGQCYLVPFFNGKTQKMECQMQPGYKGLIDLARRSGQVETICAFSVYDGDRFHVSLGTEPKIDHEPNFDADRDEDKARFFYAICKFRDGGYQFDVMSRSEINRIMGRSKSKTKDGRMMGPWETDFVEMAKKTVLKRLSKLLPLSNEYRSAVEIDNAASDGERAIVGSQAEEIMPDFCDEPVQGRMTGAVDLNAMKPGNPEDHRPHAEAVPARATEQPRQEQRPTQQAQKPAPRQQEEKPATRKKSTENTAFSAFVRAFPKADADSLSAQFHQITMDITGKKVAAEKTTEEWARVETEGPGLVNPELLRLSESDNGEFEPADIS